jgi:hypothetical protein
LLKVGGYCHMEEKPFESLARGLNKDLGLLLHTEEAAPSKSSRPSRLGSVFGLPDVPIGMAQGREKSFGQQPFESQSDRFAHEIVIFPLTNHVVINKSGAFIPQSIFGTGTDLAYEEERNQNGAINITVHPKQPAVPATKQPQFGSARGLIKMSNDFDEPLEDFADYM